MYGKDILCGISKVSFEIPHKISDPYIERWWFYTVLKIWELLDLRGHKCFWNASQYHTIAATEGDSRNWWCGRCLRSCCVTIGGKERQGSGTPG